ncbi:MAG: DUF4915 domain-containing protein [bacterium]
MKEPGKRFRNPSEVVGLWSDSKFQSKLLEARADKGWTRTLERLGVTLLVSREYEHLVLALEPGLTTWLTIPHPSGLRVDHRANKLHIASTRNPNLLMEFQDRGGLLFPTRARFLPGALYLHELALIGGQLYGNAVGHNAIARLDYERGAKLVWWPTCVERGGKPVFRKNHIQLNSIAAGKTLRESFFSVTSDRMDRKVPGDPSYPVDRRGVIFSGATREPVVRGLTRPHSARLHRGELWVNNSGYGEVGHARNGKFEPWVRLGGWTRGLCFVQDVLFVGVSKILPRFQAYAPGLELRKSWTGVAAIDPRSGKILGKIVWPHGNQVFDIDWIKNARFPSGAEKDLGRVFYSLGETPKA